MTGILFYSICAVVLIFITRISVRLFSISTLMFTAKKSVVLYKIGKKLSPGKMKKDLEFCFPISVRTLVAG